MDKEGQGQGGTVNRGGAICIACGARVSLNFIRTEGKVGRINNQLIAIVAEGQRGRVYIPTDNKQISIAEQVKKPANILETNLPEKALSFRVQVYGMTRHRDLYTSRQLTTLTTLSHLVKEVRDKILVDAGNSGMS